MKKFILSLLLIFLLGVTLKSSAYIAGTKVLIPDDCCVYGYVLYESNTVVMASPYTCNCGPFIPMKPQVVIENFQNCGFWDCCMGWSLRSNDSFIIESLSGEPQGAYVVFAFTIDYPFGQSQSFNFPGYVNCWENLTSCT